MQGGNGDMRLWEAVTCEFVSALSVQWTEQSAPVLQGDDGGMRLWGAVACEFVSELQGVGV